MSLVVRVVVVALEEGANEGLVNFATEEYAPTHDESDPQQTIIAVLAMLHRMIDEADKSVEIQGKALLRKTTAEDRSYTRRKAVTHRERRS